MNRNSMKYETFNAIEMKRHIQEQMYEDTKDMTPEEMKKGQEEFFASMKKK